MKVPDEFANFCIPFDPDIFEQDKDQYLPGEDVISFAVRQASDRQKRVVRDFIDKVLAASLSDRELANIWSEACYRVGFVNDGDYRRVFEKIRQRLT